MIRALLISLTPDLVLGAGILASSLTATRTAHAGWLAIAGPLVLTASVALAALLAARRPDAPRGEGWSTLITVLAVGIAGFIVVAGNPDKIASMMPILGAAVAMPIILRRRARRFDCVRRPSAG